MNVRHTIERLRALGFKKALAMKLENFQWTKLFSIGEWFGLSILPAHFYSPVPDTRILRKTFRRWHRPSELPGINLHLETQKQYAGYLSAYREEYAALPDYDWATRQGLGEGYTVADAHLLYGMLRHHKPKRIIEIGSGISTFFALQAIKKNAAEGSPCAITCIEPYPRKGLQNLASQGQVSLMSDEVQNCSLELFQDLGEGDILFIDSSHVLKLDSDVWFIYLEILPRLRNGVVIHIHDIFFPYPTPEPEVWIFRQHQFWNETAFVQALLMNNPTFSILFCSAYQHHTSPATLQSITPVYQQKTPPSSLWLQRTLA